MAKRAVSPFTPTMQIEIRVTCDDREVEDLIGQDPMGDLLKGFRVVINGRRFLAKCEGYSASNGRATLVIYGNEVP